MKHKIYLIIMLCFFFCSCVAQNNYKQVCQSWVGHDINDLIRAWGYPQRTNTMPNGNMVYTYHKSNTETDPVFTLPGQTTYNKVGNTVYKREGMGMTVGGDTVTYYCVTSFETTPSGSIVFWRYEGNRCR